jgi:hypothetical protein
MVNQMNKRKDSGVQVDDPIAFRFLKGRKQGGVSGEVMIMFEFISSMTLI